jgi:PEP-CTERM motif
MTPWFRGLRVATALCGLAAPLGASALPLLSEVFYDAVGPDDGLSFVEIYATPGTALDGLVVEGINGADGSVAGSITLSGVVPADGLFVIGDDAGDGTTLVSGADAIANFDFQNGPDSIVLRSATEVLDAVGYGVFGPGEFFAGEGSPAPDVAAGSSLARVFADVDTDDNALDFAGGAPTPGTAAFASVPEPNSVALLASGLAALGWQGRRRARGAPTSLIP